jgi:signal transduction histidine kinase
MNRTRWTWLAFFMCAALLLQALGWITYLTLRLEGRERESRVQAAFHDATRLALFRIDSKLIQIFIQEAARPYFQYQPFYAANRPYPLMGEEPGPEEPLTPSPLLRAPGRFVRLYFQRMPTGELKSPQSPGGRFRELAAALPEAHIMDAEQLLTDLDQMIGAGGLAETAALTPADGEGDSDGLGAADGKAPAAVQRPTQAEQSRTEYNIRQQAAQMARNAAVSDRANGKPTPGAAPAAAAKREITFNDRLGRLAGAAGEAKEVFADASDEVRQDELVPLWRTDPRTDQPELLLVRGIHVRGQTIRQGLWMDWPALRGAMLNAVADLLPGARLEPVLGGEPPDAGLALANIPAMLSPGPPLPVGAEPALTPTRASLLVTWAAVLAGITAIGLVLRASTDLSERRGRFVAAVTHELRTPLTTFCLYSQMLADGMVTDETARREYLVTLKEEAQRLARIVQNVLEYARLGDRRPGAGAALIGVPELLARICPALRRRAEQAGMELVVEISAAAEAAVRVDPQTVERILFNVVDNACKYASGGPDRRIHLGAREQGKAVEISVSDHGPGVAVAERRSVFKPFRRGRSTDSSITGLGLGLALARGLARELDGDLRLMSNQNRGAMLILVLPLGIRVPR